MSQVPQQPTMPPFQMPSGGFGEYLAFRKMITPIVIQVLFWILVVVFVIGGIMMISTGPMGALGGILFIPLGILGARIWCELVIVFFRVRELLEEIRDNTKR